MDKKNYYLIKIHNLMYDLSDATVEKDEDKVRQIVGKIKELLDEFE